MRRSTVGYKKPGPGEYILREGWYWPDKPCRYGHLAPRNHFRHCMECVRLYRSSRGHFAWSPRKKAWEQENKEKRAETRRAWSLRNPEKYLVNACRAVAKKKDLPFDLSEDDIKIPDICPVLGIHLERGVGDKKDSSPSIDRIVPALGYVRGNIIIISWRANRIKCDATLREMRMLADFYEKLASRDA